MMYIYTNGECTSLFETNKKAAESVVTMLKNRVV